MERIKLHREGRLSQTLGKKRIDIDKLTRYQMGSPVDVRVPLVPARVHVDAYGALQAPPTTRWSVEDQGFELESNELDTIP